MIQCSVAEKFKATGEVKTPKRKSKNWQPPMQHGNKNVAKLPARIRRKSANENKAHNNK